MNEELALAVLSGLFLASVLCLIFAIHYLAKAQAAKREAERMKTEGRVAWENAIESWKAARKYWYEIRQAEPLRKAFLNDRGRESR